MSGPLILECLKEIKIKNCEGYDLVPQRVLVDGAEILIAPYQSFLKRYTPKKPSPLNGQLPKLYRFTKKAPETILKIIDQ